MQSWTPDSQRFAVLIASEDELLSIGIYHVDPQMLSELPVTIYPPYALAWSSR